jgi:hypothetical protein
MRLRLLFGRHIKTLRLIFDEPPGRLSWKRIQDLLVACEVEMLPAPGNGTLLRLKNEKTEIHTPEGDPPPGTIRKTRSFLEQAGLTPTRCRIF